MTFRAWDLKEERLNATLDVLFLAHHHQDYMVIFEDGDLHRYVDHKLKPEQGVKIRSLVQGVCFQPQKFRPDVVMLDTEGYPHIVETKIGSALLSRKQCFNLVVQTLVYASLIVSPRWNGASVCATPYEVFDLLHKAHWFRHRRFEGACLSLKLAHKIHFNLPDALRENEFGSKPSVIFLIEDASQRSHDLHLERLCEACEIVHKLNWSEFKDYALQHLPLNSPFRKRLSKEVGEQTWEVLRVTKFSFMPFYPSRLADVLGDSISIP